MISRIVNNLKGIISKSTMSPIQTDFKYQKPYIHLGCGDINLEGWINIDARNRDHVHILTDEITLNQFADNSVGVIYLSHVLEHFDFLEVQKLLEVFYTKLKSGGVLLIAVPDFAAISDLYQTTQELKIIEKALMGGQDYQYNYHKSVYDMKLLKAKLKTIGFGNVARYETLDEFGKDLGDFSTYHINGKLVSLNIRAKKN
jgi:predicted SAM-dependent methyltransferase